MKKFYLLIILLVYGFGFGQVKIVGNANYELKLSNGYVRFSGSSCGDAVTGGLQWIAAEYQNPKTFSSMIQGTASYPNYGNGLANQAIGPKSILFTENNKIINLKIGTTHRDSGTFGCKDTDYNFVTVPLTTNFYTRNLNFSDLGLNQPGNVLVTVTPIINLSNTVPENDIISTKSTIVIQPIAGVLEQYYNWMYHIEGDMIAYTVYVPDPDPDCGGGSPILLGLSARIIDPDNPPIDCPDIPVTKYRERWILLPPAYQNVTSLNIKCKDFLPFNLIGKNVQLKVNDNGALVNLKYRLSAPIVESFVTTDSKCYDDTDTGSVRFLFDDTLMPGEQLNYSLLDVDTNTPTSYRGSINIADDKSFVIPNLKRGKYELQLVGFKDGLITDVNTHTFPLQRFEIGSPIPVDFNLSKTDVRCHGGQDGTITINASGGTEKGYQYSIDNGSWVPFKNATSKTETINGLYPLQTSDLSITYNIRVRDANECSAKIQTVVEGKIELGAELSKPITISQPPTAISLTNTLPFLEQPTFHGAVNGSITISITGGTPNTNAISINGDSYSFEWTNVNYTKAELVSKTTTQYSNGIYSITLKNVKAGTYSLTVQDSKGCTLNPASEPKLEIVLNEPDAIVVTLTVSKSISCNTENLDSDPNKLSDGVITATVKGGVPLAINDNSGLLYYYTWSKLNMITNQWDVLTDFTGVSATSLSKGSYSLNVEDAKGIVQGTYNTTDLVTAIPTTKQIAEPTKLELSFASGNVSCYEGNNGWATATVTGGKAPYTCTWYNTGNGTIDQNKIAQLTAGEYFVEVTDAKGCFTKGNIIINEPSEEVKIEYEEIFTPTFSGATNGKIIAKITGGTPNDDQSYNYEWKNATGVLQTTTAVLENGIYTITLNGVPADDYFLTIKDKNYNEATSQIINCSVVESKVTLNEPHPLKVVFQIIRTISCNTSNEFGNAKDTTPTDGQRDESQDGILVAHVTGGAALANSENNGLPYYFYWKKQQTDGSWTALPNITGETASNLSHGNYALNVKDRNGIMLGSYVNNQLAQEIDVTQFMQEPPKLSITITKGDVFCNGGNDGWATANVVGGTPPYNYNWSNGVSVFENTILKAGKYVINITDAKGCATQNEVTIIEPINPIIVKVEKTINPSFYQATNGEITVTVKGGTLFPNNSYWYEWKNSKGIVQKTTTTTFLDGVYTITLNDLPEETYNLTISDANYSVATSKIGCTVLNTMVSLEDPDPLEVTFEVVRKISCNVTNTFGNETDAHPQDNQRDESQDGIVIAHVKGGIPLQANQNNGLGYFYTWKKQQKDGSWTIWNDKDETAEYLSDGMYALNIEDANGIKLGTYVNNQLTKEIDVTQLMPQPAKLSLTFTKLDVGCTTGDDGWAEAHVSGGTPPYTYEWTNGEITAKIQNITTNNYFVIATDAKGCVVQGSIFVGDPHGIFTTETIKNPTCFKGNDASIQLNVTGGNVPYSFLWSTGATTKDLNNLTAGTYEVAIMCPDCCVYKKKFVIADPEPIIGAIGPDRTLCNDQNLDLDATIDDPKAQYSWTSTNGFTSNEAKVTLSKAGTYRVKVTSGLGCFGEDEIVIKTSQTAISSEFLLSSQAYLDEEVILINTSNPFGEGTNWIIPKGVKVVEQKEKYITLKFDAVGVYTIGLQQTQGECYATYSKNITVEQRGTLPNNGTSSQFIVGFVVTPNPNDGNFKAVVTLENSSAINLRLFSASGQFTSIQKKESAKKKYEVDFNTSLAAGMYILVLETEQQTLVKKIIIY